MTNTELNLENSLLQLELAVKEAELYVATNYPDMFDILHCSTPDDVVDAVIKEYGTSSVLSEMGLADIVDYFEPDEILEYLGEDEIKDYVSHNYYAEDWVQPEWNY